MNDRYILPRAVVTCAIAAGVTVLCEFAAPRLLTSPHVPLRYVGAVASGLGTGGVAVAFFALMYAAAAASSIAIRRLEERGLSARTIRISVTLLLSAFVLALFVFLPFCLGSLSEGTYDCIPLATRMLQWLRR